MSRTAASPAPYWAAKANDGGCLWAHNTGTACGTPVEAKGRDDDIRDHALGMKLLDKNNSHYSKLGIRSTHTDRGKNSKRGAP